MHYNNLNQIHIQNFSYKIQVFNCPIYHPLIYAVILDVKPDAFTSIIWKKILLKISKY